MRYLFLSVVLAGQAMADSPAGGLSQRSALEVLAEAKRIQPHEIRMIDAKDLSVEDLIALAVAERENATRLQCCDWGGSCLPHDHDVIVAGK